MHTLFICRTCPRERAEKGGLAGRLQDLAAHSPLPTGFQILSVECLGGCPLPCNVALDAPGKWRVRLSRLAAAHAAGLLVAARGYADSPDGRLTDATLPPELRGHISALAPKRLNQTTR